MEIFDTSMYFKDDGNKILVWIDSSIKIKSSEN